MTVGGVVVEMLIDLGGSTNDIDKNLWSKLKQEKIKCVLRKSDKKLYAYVLGTFSALVRVEKKPKPNLSISMVKERHCMEEKLPYT